MKSESQSLLEWYEKLNYYMPWRKDADPYKIWISEIMLQQTQVETVKKYFSAWIDKYPNIEKLSKSNIDDILKLWEGLGYYKRAHHILETAKIIVSDYNGQLPDKYSDLIKLKGIGDYTASAISSIAFNKPYPAIDGNLKRVLSRLYCLNNTKTFEAKLKHIVLKYMECNLPGNINQAFMDLGREICTPQKPKCDDCPLNYYCKAYKTSKVYLYPIKNKKIKKKPVYDVVVGLIYKKNKFLIAKRKKNVLLGGLWELPGGKKKHKEDNADCLHREIKEELNITVKINKKIGIIKHNYSHFSINLTGYFCSFLKGTPKPLASDDIKWIKTSSINNFAFPKSTNKLFELIKEKN